MPVLSYLDEPTNGALCDPLGFFVQGWIHDPNGNDAIESVEVFSNEEKLGETFTLSERADVCAALQLASGTRTGFRILCHALLRPEASERTLEFRARRGGESVTFTSCAVRFMSRDYRQAPFGKVLRSDFLPILHREHVYTSGPSWAGTSHECRELIHQFVGPPPKRILDVGCGFGGYGQELIQGGYDWLGVEMKESDLSELARRGLPHQRVDGKTLPFPDRSFDAAMCIEVLEHIDDVDAFLREVSRVAPRLMVSVPNFEIVPYLNDFHAVPWHILEADHKNFFTRWSLKHLLAQHFPQVEVTAYGLMPLHTPEGTRLFYHLFACANF